MIALTTVETVHIDPLSDDTICLPAGVTVSVDELSETVMGTKHSDLGLSPVYVVTRLHEPYPDGCDDSEMERLTELLALPACILMAREQMQMFGMSPNY